MDFSRTSQNVDIRSRESLNKEILNFTLSLYNNLLLSRKAVDFIINTFNDFLSKVFVPYIENEMEIHLKPITNEVSYAKAQFILANSKHIFSKYKTEHSRIKIYEEESGYIPPQLFEIGKEPTYVNKDQTIHVEMKPIYGAYIPLKETLQTALSRPSTFEQILNYINYLSEDKFYLSNVLQGDLWKKKYADRNKIILPLFVYYDEFETRNPLGSHAGEEKLGGVYVSIACLPPHLTAKLNNVYVSTIFHSKHLKKFGNKSIFRKTIEDLNTLSTNGIIIKLKGSNQVVHFQCVQILGDNLGLNTICGFSESFTAKYYCRICSATYEECQNMIEENEALVRTVQSYTLDVLQNNSSSTGIKEECIFNQINNFHICENITVDVMHDLSEGVAAYTIGKILQALITAKILSLSIINNRIETFEYGELEKSNKPRPLYFSQGKKGEQKLKIKQSSSELLCLSRYLALMIGDIIPADNSYWKIYLSLRKIIGIVTSPTLDKGQINNFHLLVKKHNIQYLQLFGKLKPKMHLLLHYTRIMLLNGPAIHYSSLKYERKNRKLKEIAAGTLSNVNLPITIAIRHQLQLCIINESSSTIQGDVIFGPVVDPKAHSSLKQLVPNLCENISVVKFKYVEILGKKYSTGTVFVIKVAEDYPQFGVIKNIFYCTNVYFQAKVLNTINFNHNYHAYNVCSNSNNPNIVINVDMIPKIPPCLLVSKNNNELVSMRYDI